MDDVLEELDTTELTMLTSVFADNIDQGCKNQVAMVREMTLLSEITVTNDIVKWFMNWVNSRAK